MAQEDKDAREAGPELDRDGAADGNSYAYENKCNCDKCQCPICARIEDGQCVCCAHGCTCCGHNRDVRECDCEDDCGCEPGDCNCGHGPCASEACTCACGCGGHGTAHVCPVCGMELKEGKHCACSAGPCNCAGAGPEVKRMSKRAAAGVVALASIDMGLRVWAVTRALKRDDKAWVLPLTLINSLGILPTVYLASHS